MSFKKIYLVIVPVLVLALLTSAFGYAEPRLNKSEIDDHPWGGELAADQGGNVNNGITMTFIGTPFTFIDYFRVLTYIRTVRQISIIRGASSINTGTSGSSSNSTMISTAGQRDN
jgi:hypothetical protein